MPGNRPSQVPQGIIEKPVKIRYDPVAVRGSFKIGDHWRKNREGVLKRRTQVRRPACDCICMILTEDKKQMKAKLQGSLREWKADKLIFQTSSVHPVCFLHTGYFFDRERRSLYERESNFSCKFWNVLPGNMQENN